MKKEHTLLVRVETYDEESLTCFKGKLYFDMDRPEVYVVSVKEIR